MRGQPILDEWLRGHAHRAHTQGTARTRVWTADGSNRVVAYFSIAPTQVAREELSSSRARGASVVPAYLLARLALDRSLRGQRLGSEPLVDALTRIVAAADVADVADVAGERMSWWTRSMIRRPSSTPITTSCRSVVGVDAAYPRRMVMKVTTARRTLDW